VCFLEGSEEKWDHFETIDVENLFFFTLVFKAIVPHTEAFHSWLNIENRFLTHVNVFGLVRASIAQFECLTILDF